MKGAITALVLMGFLSGCETGPSYRERIENRPLPATAEEKQKECSMLRSEIARFRVPPYIPPSPNAEMFALIAQQNASEAIAIVEARAASVQCTAAFSNAVAASTQGQDINQCIAACKAHTDRSPEQCFDSCNK